MTSSAVTVHVKLKKSSAKKIKDMTNALLDVKDLLEKNLAILQNEIKFVKDKK